MIYLVENVNDEKLVEFVYVHPVLYDQSNSKYMDSDYKKSILRKIGAEMKSDAEYMRILISYIIY